MAVGCKNIPPALGRSCLVPFFRVQHLQSIPNVTYCTINLSFGDKACTFGQYISCEISKQDRRCIYFFSIYIFFSNELTLVVCELDDNNEFKSEDIKKVSFDQLRSVSEDIMAISELQRQKIVRDAVEHVFNYEKFVDQVHHFGPDLLHSVCPLFPASPSPYQLSFTTPIPKREMMMMMMMIVIKMDEILLESLSDPSESGLSNMIPDGISTEVVLDPLMVSKKQQLLQRHSQPDAGSHLDYLTCAYFNIAHT
jgi:hypothetical protein